MIINFDNTFKTAEEILSTISEKDIYEFYFRTRIKEGRLYKCPFHKDKDPSLGFKLMPSTVLIHRCFGCGQRGNIFSFVSKLLSLSYWDTIKQINRDFQLVELTLPVSREVIKRESIGFTTEETNSRIYPVYQNFNIIDFNYWNRYEIPLSLLLKYDIKSCKQVFIKNRHNNDLVLFAEYSKKNPIYCYKIDDTYKIYRPLNPTKVGKWLSTTRAEDIQGMKQLPFKGKLLIITSSMKDLLVLKILGYNAIALGGEGNRIPAKILDYLKESFKEIIIFYDNDEAGIKYANKLSEEIEAEYVYIPIEYKEKDISDYTERYSIKQARCLIKKLLNEGRKGRDSTGSNREEIYLT